MKKKRKVILVVAIAVAVIALAIFLADYIPKSFMVENKSVRINNMIDNSGNINSSAVSKEVEALLTRYVNWDNLFVSEIFKNKYKNKQNIIDNFGGVYRIWVAPDHNEKNENVVLVYAYYHKEIFDTGEYATQYHFKYALNASGEIEDLVRIDKCDIHVPTGEVIENR